MSICKHKSNDGLCLLHSEPYYKEPCHEGPCHDYNAMTNADRIRAMTDEELAGFISVMSSCNGCKAKSSETAHPCFGLYEGCKGNWLDWLKQEVSDEKCMDV